MVNPDSSWCQCMDNRLDAQIRKSRQRLENPYAFLDDKGEFDAVLRVEDAPAYNQSRNPSPRNIRLPAHREDSGPKTESNPELVRLIDPDALFGHIRKGKRLARREIESIVRNFQRQLWAHRAKLYPQRASISPLDVLDPGVALGSIGFRYQEAASLGEHDIDGERLEVAGQIDAPGRAVRVSLRYRPAVRRFTVGHELAHAVLHGGIGLHRDRALDGAPPRSSRSRTEWEADQFAVFFLMPEKLVRTAFAQIFGTEKFVLTEDTAFRLNAGGFEELKKKCKEQLFLSRLLAGTTQYDGMHFVSLCKQFGVSNLTMAIRLSELELIHN